MMEDTNAPILANDIALRFPEGFWAEFGRLATGAYFNADRNTRFDPEIGTADRKSDRGHRRRSYMNNAMRKLEEIWPEQVKARDVCMGQENGSNNHVEVAVDKYVLTHHHLTGVRILPDDSKYLDQNTGLNEELEQRELIPLREYMPQQEFEKPFNLLVLHREDPEAPAEIGEVELVFAKGRKRLATFLLKDIARIQARLAELSPEELWDFKFKHEEAKRRHIA